MRVAVQQSKLGAPKSASEGAERDREWPSTVPKRSGEVIEVMIQACWFRQFATEHKPERRQTYQLKGRKPYVNVAITYLAAVSWLERLSVSRS